MSECLCDYACYVQLLFVIQHKQMLLFYRYEYESTDTSTDEMKKKFAHTMEFVEEYLKDVVSQPFPFGDKDKNELTLEVK